jgi:hypothetical protein
MQRVGRDVNALIGRDCGADRHVQLGMREA